jgi:hypothetical protein
VTKLLEHPTVTEINRFGYPKEMLEQPEHFGTDFFGDEVLVGDDYVEIDGEIILMDNLDRFLSEQLGFEFKTAE